VVQLFVQDCEKEVNSLEKKSEVALLTLLTAADVQAKRPFAGRGQSDM